MFMFPIAIAIMVIIASNCDLTFNFEDCCREKASPCRAPFSQSKKRLRGLLNNNKKRNNILYIYVYVCRHKFLYMP